MPSSYDAALVRELLSQILRSTDTISRRFVPVQAPSDFIDSDEGMEKLDAICMQLIALGESVKNLDKVTHGELLIHYPSVEWKRVMGMRDVISHHYFDLDAEIVFTVCTDHIEPLTQTVRQILSEL